MPNPDTLHAADLSQLTGFDAVIDVRSPAEFAEDHVPGAVNLPVLSDAERAIVGTIYVQDSAFRARKIGAALVAKNVAHHLDTALADRPSTFRPLIYCWRGGQRSNAMATILAQIGWRTLVLEGGYRTYRRMVQRRLYDEPLGLELILLDGDTGTGKTDVLGALSLRGVQSIDLEGLAEHRGSLFGGRPGQAQPSQKMFESRLLSALQRLDPQRPVVVEAESHKIGDRMIPPVLWGPMGQAPRIVLRASRAERATYLAGAYADIAADLPSLKALIARLPVHISKAAIEHLGALADAGDLIALADALMELHYDPAYARSTRKDERRIIGTVDVSKLDTAGVEAAARSVAECVEARRGPVAGGQGLEP
jgi:tRNA 2-selenouridine synthase